MGPSTPIRRTSIPRKELLALAPMLLECGARAVTVSKVLGLSATDARNIYRDLFGGKSASGKTPESESWYLDNDSRRIHTSLFLHIYDEVIKFNYDPVRGFLRAYTMYYHDICLGSTELTPERAHLLVLMKRDAASLGSKDEIPVKEVRKSVFSAETNKSKSGKKIIKEDDRRSVDVIVFKSCRKCGVRHIVSKASMNYKCPICLASENS